jgi:hypothetical protein
MMQKGGSGSYDEDAPKKMSFKQAFASARKGGEKTFEWNGKKYHTRTKEDEAKAKPKAAAPKEDPKPKVDAVSRHREVKRGLDALKAGAPATRGPISKAYSGDGMPSAPAMPKGRMASGPITDEEYKKGGSVKKYAQGGSVSGRADGIAKKGKTSCKMV